jgi:hypothetical protein
LYLAFIILGAKLYSNIEREDDKIHSSKYMRHSEENDENDEEFNIIGLNIEEE